MTSAIGLLSGGLDSILAVKVLQKQDIHVECVCFVTPFFGPEKARLANRQPTGNARKDARWRYDRKPVFSGLRCGWPRTGDGQPGVDCWRAVGCGGAGYALDVRGAGCHSFENSLTVSRPAHYGPGRGGQR